MRVSATFKRALEAEVERLFWDRQRSVARVSPAFKRTLEAELRHLMEASDAAELLKAIRLMTNVIKLAKQGQWDAAMRNYKAIKGGDRLAPVGSMANHWFPSVGSWLKQKEPKQVEMWAHNIIQIWRDEARDLDRSGKLKLKGWGGDIVGPRTSYLTDKRYL